MQRIASEPTTVTSAMPGRSPLPARRGLERPISPVDRLAFDRERAIRNTERAAYADRLKQAIQLGLFIWTAAALLDGWVVHFVGVGSLSRLLWLRAAGLVVGVAAYARLRRSTRPSLNALRVMDLAAFTCPAVLLAMMCVHLGGIASPYATGMIVILVARGATASDRGPAGAWLFGAPALAYPAVMIAASCLYPDVRAQFSNPRALGLFGVSLTLLAMTWFSLTVGGNFVWRLRREMLEARRIGRYELQRRLGSGGMGEVWAAYDARLGQRVALKLLRRHQHNPSAVARFEREARALAGLSHPHIVSVSDYGVTDDGIWYYAMELLEGQNLRDLVETEGPLEPRRLIALAVQLAGALVEAHARGVIHRDIKPENVVVSAGGGQSEIAKLLDFGVAKTSSAASETLTATGWTPGTPAYMAPEALQGRPVDARSDIYALGATLRFALDGAPIPEDLARVMRCCLESDPAARYPTSRALLSALSALSGAPAPRLP